MSCRCTGRRKCSLFACDMWEVSARKKSFFLLHLLLLLNFIWMDGPQIPISISFSELSVQAVLSIAMKCTVWCPAGWGLLIFPACGQQLLRGDREKVAPVDISSHGDVMVSKWAPGVSWWDGTCSVVQAQWTSLEWGWKEPDAGQEDCHKQLAGACRRIQELGKKASQQVEEKRKKKGECGNLSWLSSIFSGKGGREYFFSLMGQEGQGKKRSAWEMCQVVVNHSPKGLCCSKGFVSQEKYACGALVTSPWWFLHSLWKYLCAALGVRLQPFQMFPLFFQ